MQDDHPVDWHLLPLGVLLKILPQVCVERGVGGVVDGLSDVIISTSTAVNTATIIPPNPSLTLNATAFKNPQTGSWRRPGAGNFIPRWVTG